MALNSDSYAQYSDGKTLLSTALTERDQLLHELETWAQALQGKSSVENVLSFDLSKVQLLLYELMILTAKIDMLILQINGYADQCGQPYVMIHAPEQLESA